MVAHHGKMYPFHTADMSSGALVCVPANGCTPLVCEVSVAKIWYLGVIVGILSLLITSSSSWFEL